MLLMDKFTSQDSVNSNLINPSWMINEVATPESKGRPSLLWILVSQFLALAWLAPIIVLLALNFEGYIAGASVGCGVRRCNDNLWADNAAQRSSRLHLEDHNILGALQLVSKTMEVWFVSLAGCLVYDLTMLLAKKGHGLPIRYITTLFEFGQLRSFLNKTFWTSISPSINSRAHSSIANSPQTYTPGIPLASFILFVAGVCIICNLMGPATAVLLLPTLVWREVQIPQTQAFADMASPEPPTSLKILEYCNASALAAGHYSCTRNSTKNVLDSMLSLTTQGDGQLADLNQATFVTFSFNLSKRVGEPVLVPNRQTLSIIDFDFNEWSFSGDGLNYTTAAALSKPETLSQSTYNALRNAQEVKRLRQGPGLLFSAQCYPDVSVIKISDDKVVRCYDLPNPDLISTYEGTRTAYPYPTSTTANGFQTSTMCIRVGSGWVGRNAHSTFSIGTSSTDSITVDVYSSDRAIYLTSTTYHCSANKVTTNSVPCNWDALFSVEPAPEIKNATINPLVTEYSLSGKPTFWCRSFAFLRFPTYVFDASAITNPLYLVILEDNGPVTSTDEPISIHPDWTLATWSVDKGQTVPGDRISAQALAAYYLDGDYDNFTELHSVVTAQSLSLIDYSMKDIDTAGSVPTNPILQVSLLVYVWSYGLESRTSKLGVVVVLLGCVIVLTRMVVGVWTRTVRRNLLEFVITALEQCPPGIFPGLKKKDFGKIRFLMKNQQGAEFEFAHQEDLVRPYNV